MRTKEILDLLVELDATYPTDAWTVGGVHVLPLVRYEIYNGNYDLYLRPSPERSPARFAGLRDRLRSRAAGLRRRIHAARTDRQASVPLAGPVDAVLYSDGVSFVELAGKHYDRFLDPLRERLEEAGARPLVLTPIDNYLVPRHAPSAFVQPLIDRAHTMARIRSRVPGQLPEASLPGYVAMQALLASRGIRTPQAEHLQRLVLYIEEFAALYTRWLTRLVPRVVYVVAYYGSERFAMMLAANRLGIDTVDVQHGYSAELHWAYSRFDRVPPGGYALLPKWFWCWTEDEHRSMSAWADRTAGAHRVRVGGILFQETWRSKDPTPLVRTYDAEIEALLARHPGRRALLYTASGFEPNEQLHALAAAMTRTPDLHWYYRLHPCRLEGSARIEQVLRNGGASSFDVANATRLPLYALLRHVDLHLTESSSTVIEAASFGVPSVLWGSIEAPSFARYIASGWLVVAEPRESQEDVAAALHSQLAARAALVAGQDATGPSGLDELLGLALPGLLQRTTTMGYVSRPSTEARR